MIRVSYTDAGHNWNVFHEVSFETNSMTLANSELNAQLADWIENQMYDAGYDPDSNGRAAKRIRNELVRSFYENNVIYEIR